MRDTVTVDGVTLTRAQIEEAQRRLNEPVSVVAVANGDVVVDRDSGYAHFVRDATTGDWSQQNGKSSYGALYLPDHLIRVGSLSEIVAFYREQKDL